MKNKLRIHNIESYTDSLKKIWMENPDLRLGQLIKNTVDNSIDDLYYVSDEDLIIRMVNYYTTLK